MKAIIGWIAAGTLLAAGTTWACQPCPEWSSMAESVATADLIAVVEATEGVQSNPEGKDGFIKVKVERVLKGKAAGEITVRSWHGMCPYGLFMAKGQRAVVLLNGANGGYDSLSARCGVGGLKLTDSSLQVEGQTLTVEAFAAKYITSTQP